MADDLKNLHIPVLPRVAREALVHLYKPEPDVRMLSRLLGTDSGLSGDILKLANSPYCGVHKPTSELQTAVIRIGLHSLRQVVLTHTMSKHFSFDISVKLDSKEFWRHSAFVGQMAFELARKDFKNHADEMQLAGLLHDVGIFIDTMNNPKRFAQIFEHSKVSKLEIAKSEAAFGETPHRQLGVVLAKEWQLSDTVKLCIGLHDVADRSNRGVLTEVEHTLVDIMVVSDRIAHRYGFGLNGYHPDSVISPDILQRLNINSASILSAVQRVRTFLEVFN